jgi:general stress protein YciG
MTPTECGRLGGIATSKAHRLEPCPCCGRMTTTRFYQENGAVGGEVTVARYGVQHMAEIGRKGGRKGRQAADAAVDSGEGALTSRPPRRSQ